MTFLLFFITLFLLVIIHEWGHYIVAKKSGVRVEEFGFGLPPRVFGRKFGKKPAGQDDRTLYSLNLLPLGGFVRLTGEDEVAHDGSDPKNFQNVALWKRMAVVLAGVTMNFIVGILIFATVYSIVGIPKPQLVTIREISPDSPAQQVGLQVEDQVVAINNQEIKSVSQFQQIIALNLDKQIDVTIKRGGEETNFQVTPRKDPPAGQGAVGVALLQDVDYQRYPWYQMPFYGALAGLKDAYEMIKQVVPSLLGLVSSIAVKQEVPQGVAGPVGLFKLTGEVFSAAGLLGVLQLAGLLSINLAIFNLLPFPALDGGRFAFMLVEGITGRKVPARIEQYAHALGMALLILLILFVTYNDIFKQTVLPR